jgi:hypothetical protein
MKPGSVGGRALRGQLEELYRTRYERFLRVALAFAGSRRYLRLAHDAGLRIGMVSAKRTQQEHAGARV